MFVIASWSAEPFDAPVTALPRCCDSLAGDLQGILSAAGIAIASTPVRPPQARRW